MLIYIYIFFFNTNYSRTPAAITSATSETKLIWSLLSFWLSLIYYNTNNNNLFLNYNNNNLLPPLASEGRAKRAHHACTTCISSSYDNVCGFVCLSVCLFVCPSVPSTSNRPDENQQLPRGRSTVFTNTRLCGIHSRCASSTNIPFSETNSAILDEKRQLLQLLPREEKN